MIVNNTFSFSVETALPPNTRMQSDRFAREIVAFLALSYAARLRRLMRVFGGSNVLSLVGS